MGRKKNKIYKLIDMTDQTKAYVYLLSEKMGKTEAEIIEYAIFYFYHDKDKFIISPYSGTMWLNDEIPTLDDVVTFSEEGYPDFDWIQNPDAQESRNIIGEKIKKYRKEQGLTLLQLEKKTGIKMQNISRIEKGKYSTGQDILNALANALGKRLDII